MPTIAYPEIIKNGFPYIFAFPASISKEEFVRWYTSHRNEVEEALMKSGALLVRGVDVDSVAAFGAIASAVEEGFTDYIDISYQRRRLSSNVYISTEYDAAFPIKMHNELSYACSWPSRLWFGCIIPAETGGETPLADSRAILRELDDAILEEYNRKKVRYVRNLHNGQGLGPSWQETFKTSDKKKVDQYCTREEMQCHWKANGGIKLEAIRPPVRKHPRTGESVWFSVAELYHPSHFDEEYYQALLKMVNGDEEELPLYSSFGDGTKISNEMVAEVISTIEKQRRLRAWEKGDLVIVDNMLTSHGRMPYTGERQTVVYLCK